MSITIDSTIIAVIVSAVISVAILLVSNYFIQPRRLRQNWIVENLEKRLEVYGALITVIDSMQAKRKRFPLDKLPENDRFPFEMETPFDYNRLLAVLEKKNYLLSKEISQLWFKLLTDDVHFKIFSALKKEPLLLSVDFKDIQEKAKKEYSEMKSQYEKLTGIKLPN